MVVSASIFIPEIIFSLIQSGSATTNDEQLSESREVFCYFDAKGDDKIGVAQVGDVLRALGQNPTEAEIRRCCAHWTSADARISFEDFLPIYQSVAKARDDHSLEEFVEGLSHFDKEGNGMINVAELRHLLTTLGKSDGFVLHTTVMMLVCRRTPFGRRSRSADARPRRLARQCEY